MHSNKIETRKKSLTLNDRQREIVVGLLLGDGHLEIQNNGRTYRLKIEHSIQQKEYVDWLYEEFKEWINTPPQSKKQLITFSGVTKEYEKYWFNTLSSGSFRFYAQQFYLKSRKVVPRLIKKLLTPLSLAVWYMDDGGIKSKAHSTVLFSTHGFDDGSIHHLRQALLEKFGIKSTTRSQREGKQIYLLSETIEIFRDLIVPLIHPSMKYKLPKVWLT